MVGGTMPDFVLAGTSFYAPAHGLTTALPVLYTTGTAGSITPLVWGTTYYVIPVSANYLGLATSKANAQASSYVTVTGTSAPTTAHTFTLTPLPITGTPSFSWQASNDGSVWTTLASPPSVSVGSYVYPSTSTVVDMGTTDYGYIRLNVVAPTAGGLSLKVNMSGRSNNDY
jgi:hypothetical protein